MHLNSIHSFLNSIQIRTLKNFKFQISIFKLQSPSDNLFYSMWGREGMNIEVFNGPWIPFLLKRG